MAGPTEAGTKMLRRIVKGGVISPCSLVAAAYSGQLVKLIWRSVAIKNYWNR